MDHKLDMHTPRVVPLDASVRSWEQSLSKFGRVEEAPAPPASLAVQVTNSFNPHNDLELLIRLEGRMSAILCRNWRAFGVAMRHRPRVAETEMIFSR
jgi:hypothetical protein